MSELMSDNLSNQLKEHLDLMPPEARASELTKILIANDGYLAKLVGEAVSWDLLHCDYYTEVEAFVWPVAIKKETFYREPAD